MKRLNSCCTVGNGPLSSAAVEAWVLTLESGSWHSWMFGVTAVETSAVACDLESPSPERGVGGSITTGLELGLVSVISVGAQGEHGVEGGEDPTSSSKEKMLGFCVLEVAVELRSNSSSLRVHIEDCD